MRLFRASLLALLCLSPLALARPAYAVGASRGGATQEEAVPNDELPHIQLCGLTAFDDVFSKAMGIEKTVDRMYSDIVKARTALNVALGLAKDAPLETALADLKTKSKGKLKVTMTGTMPTLTPTEALPKNVKKGVDAANTLIKASVDVVVQAPTLVKQTKELIAASRSFPARLPSVLGELSPASAKKASGIVLNNVKAIKAFPKRIKRLVTESKALIEDVKSIFGGGADA